MAHLVTGYAGKEHITSADQGSFNASFFGTGQFVMEAGKQFAASIVDNNTVRVLDGDMLMQGRHIRIPPDMYEDMTITTGTAGKNRIDLICMTYEKSISDGTEKAYLEVIKGTETEGTPQPPEYAAGNILEGADRNQMPLYRVAVYGVVLSELECLFHTITTYQALAEKYEAEFMEACRNFLGSLTVFDTIKEVNANTEKQQLAGALALKEFYKAYSNLIGTGDISQIGGGTVLGAIVALSRVMAGATTAAAGTAGLVPAPAAGSVNRYLRCDGSWGVPPDTNTVYTHPSTAGNKHIPAGGSSGKILRWSADGTATWGDDKDTTYDAMTAATASAAGKAGLVPAPAAGAQAKYLRGDGTWQTPTNTTYGVATQNANGLLSAADKKKLDGIAANATKNTITFATTVPSSLADGAIVMVYEE